MVNDTTTLNGALQELGETMAANLTQQGVTSSSSEGLTTLAGKILDIQTGGGSCYKIEFSEDSYTAVGGSATLEIYLQENYQPKSGATVTVTGSDSSLYSSITNSSGIATVTVTVNSDTTFTASYSNVSANCTVTVPTYLFYDDCSSSSRLSEYGSYVSLFGTSGNGTITYNSTENAYSIAKTTNRDAFTGFKLPITATDKIKITCKVKLTSTSAYNQFGIGIQQSTSKYEFIRVRGDKYFDGFKNNTNSSIGSNTNVASFNSAYYYLEISYDGSSRVARVYDNSMSLVKEWNLSSVQSYDTPSFYLAINTNSTNSYVKEIKVESL